MTDITCEYLSCIYNVSNKCTLTELTYADHSCGMYTGYYSRPDYMRKFWKIRYVEKLHVWGRERCQGKLIEINGEDFYITNDDRRGSPQTILATHRRTGFTFGTVAYINTYWEQFKELIKDMCLVETLPILELDYDEGEWYIQD